VIGQPPIQRRQILGQFLHRLATPRPKSRRTRWHRRFANNLLKVWPALWTFLTIEGVEPTDNPAERVLRGPVIHRKLSHGTGSSNASLSAPSRPPLPAGSKNAHCSPTHAN
jgi:hypothetical protein